MLLGIQPFGLRWSCCGVDEADGANANALLVPTPAARIPVVNLLRSMGLVMFVFDARLEEKSRKRIGDQACARLEFTATWSFLGAIRRQASRRCQVSSSSVTLSSSMPTQPRTPR